MRSFWFDPYLWVHLAGLAVLPLLLEVCLVGLATGDPLLPAWMEMLLVGGVGVAPVLWMQWQKPFSIFSLVAVALKPVALTEDQRRLLRLFKSPLNQAVAVTVAIVLMGVLWRLYQLAPIAASVAPQTNRFAGLLVAATAFLGCNLFTQVPMSVLRVLLTGDQAFATTPPYPVEAIGKDFSLLGLRVNRILPPVVKPSEPVPPVEKPEAPIVSVTVPPAAVADTDLADRADGEEENPFAAAEPALAEIEPIEAPPQPSELASQVSEPDAIESGLASDPDLPNAELEALEPESSELPVEPDSDADLAVSAPEPSLAIPIDEPTAAEMPTEEPELPEPIGATEPTEPQPAPEPVPEPSEEAAPEPDATPSLEEQTDDQSEADEI